MSIPLQGICLCEIIRFFKPRKASVLRHWESKLLLLVLEASNYKCSLGELRMRTDSTVSSRTNQISLFSVSESHLFLIQVLIFKWETWWDWNSTVVVTQQPTQINFCLDFQHYQSHTYKKEDNSFRGILEALSLSHCHLSVRVSGLEPVIF